MLNSSPLSPGFALIAALAAFGFAHAAEPDAMPTAPASASGAPPTVAEQIDAYLKTSPAAVLPKESATGVTAGDEPRQVHGVVDVAVGTSGYRSAYVRSDIPVGKTGTVSIAVGETRFEGRRGGRVGPGYGQRFGPGPGLSLGDAALDPQSLRCRQAREDRSDVRQAARIEDGRPLACRAAGAPTSPQ